MKYQITARTYKPTYNFHSQNSNVFVSFLNCSLLTKRKAKVNTKTNSHAHFKPLFIQYN